MQNETLIVKGVRIPIFPGLLSPKIIEVLRSGKYEQKEAAQLSTIIEPGEIILEVGAGIGFISTIASLNPNTKRIEIFEANPELKPLIETVHKINQIDKATVHSGVLLNNPTEDTVPFYVAHNFWSSSLSPSTTSSRRVDVPAIDLNQALRRIKPTMIICDIEGGELELFENADLESVTKIFIEIHQEVLGRSNIKRLFEVLSAKGFHYDQHHSFGQVILFCHVSRESYSSLKSRMIEKMKEKTVTAAAVREKAMNVVTVPKPPPARWKSLFGGKPAALRYHLHVGAHHTSAGFIRKMLERDQQALAANGIVIWDLKTTRANLTIPMQVRDKNDRGIIDENSEKIIRSALALTETPSNELLCISDVNLMGWSPAIFLEGCYNNLKTRMKPLPDVFRGKTKVFLTINKTIDFLSMAYWEIIATRGYQPFDLFVEKSMAMQFSWLQVYKDLAAVFGRENIVVFEFETLLSHPAAVISEFIGCEFEISDGEKPALQSVTTKAVESIRIESEWKSSRRPIDVAKAAKARFPVSEESGKFDPWTPEQRVFLKANYENDLLHIPFWRPTGER